MEKKRKFIVAIVATVTILGFSAFKAFEAPKLQTYNWYEADASGNVGALIGNVLEECPGDGERCAIGLDRTHFQLSPTSPAPITNINQLNPGDMQFTQEEEKSEN